MNPSRCSYRRCLEHPHLGAGPRRGRSSANLILTTDLDAAAHIEIHRDRSIAGTEYGAARSMGSGSVRVGGAGTAVRSRSGECGPSKRDRAYVAPVEAG